MPGDADYKPPLLPKVSPTRSTNLKYESTRNIDFDMVAKSHSFTAIRNYLYRHCFLYYSEAWDTLRLRMDGSRWHEEPAPEEEPQTQSADLIADAQATDAVSATEGNETLPGLDA